jgi:ribonuclease HI
MNCMVLAPYQWRKKSYVVYNGRKTGIYTSWIDCYAQANSYKDSVVRLYDTKIDGENAWNAYNLNCRTTLQPKRNIEAEIDGGCGYYNDILSKILEETTIF